MFQIVTGYHNWEFLISVIFSLALFLFVLSLLLLLLFLDLKNAERLFFQIFHLYVWAAAGHELDILSM